MALQFEHGPNQFDQISAGVSKMTFDVPGMRAALAGARQLTIAELAQGEKAPLNFVNILHGPGSAFEGKLGPNYQPVIDKKMLVSDAASDGAGSLAGSQPAAGSSGGNVTPEVKDAKDKCMSCVELGAASAIRLSMPDVLESLSDRAAYELSTDQRARQLTGIFTFAQWRRKRG